MGRTAFFTSCLGFPDWEGWPDPSRCSRFFLLSRYHVFWFLKSACEGSTIIFFYTGFLLCLFSAGIYLCVWEETICSQQFRKFPEGGPSSVQVPSILGVYTCALCFLNYLDVALLLGIFMSRDLRLEHWLLWLGLKPLWANSSAQPWQLPTHTVLPPWCSVCTSSFLIF